MVPVPMLTGGIPGGTKIELASYKVLKSVPSSFFLRLLSENSDWLKFISMKFLTSSWVVEGRPVKLRFLLCS